MGWDRYEQTEIYILETQVNSVCMFLFFKEDTYISMKIAPKLNTYPISISVGNNIYKMMTKLKDERFSNNC